VATATKLTDTQRTKALARYAVLRPHLDGGVPLAAISRAHGIPLRTLDKPRRMRVHTDMYSAWRMLLVSRRPPRVVVARPNVLTAHAAAHRESPESPSSIPRVLAV